MSTLIPVERLWELYDYNPLTGQLISKRYSRPITGTLKHGAMGVWVGGRSTNYGRIVFAWCTGTWPKQQVDHINRDFTDNRFWNLRDCSHRQNNQNKSTFNGGATFSKAKQKWVAQIRLNGKKKHIGYFNSEAEARRAYAQSLSEAS